MNRNQMRRFIFLTLLMGLANCNSILDIDKDYFEVQGSGSGGSHSGSSSADVATSTTSGTSTMSGGGGSVGSGAGGGCDMALTCADAVTNGGADKLCDGTSSATLYDALAACTCSGACAADCGDNLCTKGSDPASACITCLQDTVNGCGKEFNDCENDI